MRIAFASDNGTDLASHTGGCRGFVILDVSTGGWRQVAFRRNPMKRGSHRGSRITIPGEVVEGEHHHLPLLDALADCRFVVGGSVGRLLTDELTAAGLVPCESKARTVEEAARGFCMGRRSGGGGSAVEQTRSRLG